ncbi:MAG: medium-chain fatty-acid--CoA ligase [Eggerthellaceae bacterium]|nr:medium-chain fatty-acid--CoA ligase [Eggerthellaceae bacterium]
MITDLKVNEQNKKEYYEKGYWTEQTLFDVWSDRVSKFPDNEYVSDNLGVRFTYAEIDDKAGRLAAWLKSVGVQNGDVVSFQMPPWSEFCILYVACLKVGAVCHPLPVTFNGEDLVYSMNLVESKAFICPTFHHKTNFEDQFLSVKDEITSLLDGAFCVHDKTVESHGTITLNQIFETFEPLTEAPESDSDEIVLILSTSGTTGRPKAVLISHNALIFSEKTFIKSLHLTREDVMFMPAPLNHATGFNHGLITPLLLGARVVLQQEFHPEESIEIMNKEGVTWSMGATPFIYDMLNVAEKKSLSFDTLKLYVCGGAPVPGTMVHRADKHGLKLCECYGSTESCPHLLVPPEDCLEWNGNWSGIACEGIEVKVVDEKGNEVPYGTQGEEISRGPHMFSGYLKNPEATAKDLSDDGWFYSGDLCIQDEQGRVKINGRKKEILIRGGINISANEVDNNLDGCPGVGSHATIGLPDDRLGERICTFIVQKGDVVPTLDSIAEYLDSIGVAKRLRPEHIEFIDEIPMTESGKVKRHQLADELDRRLKERTEKGE